jgi:hypothetical protein
LANAAKDAWVGGFRFSLVVGAVIIAAAAAIAFRFLPDRAADDVTELEPTESDPVMDGELVTAA